MLFERKCFYEFGPFRLDPETCILWTNGEVVHLEPRVAETLLVLVRAKGHVVEKAALISQVWGRVSAINENSLPRNISILRKTLETHLEGKECIETIPTRGYRFALPVRERWETDGETPVSGDIDSSRRPENQGSLSPIRRHPASIQGHRPAAPSQQSPQAQPRLGVPSRARNWLRHHWLLSSLLFATVLWAAFAILPQLLSAPFSPRVLKYEPVTHDRLDKGMRLFTDGIHVYFGEAVAGKPIVAEVPTTNGEVVRLSGPSQGFSLLNIFPGGSDLFVAKDYGDPALSFWRLPLPGGSPQFLESVRSAETTWSPDAQHVAYRDKEGHTLYVSNADGTNPHQVISFRKEFIQCPGWSPNGAWLRLTAWNDESDTTSLWEAAPDGSRSRAFWNNQTREGCGSWTPDGKYYLFDSRRDGRWDIWAMPYKRTWLRRESRGPVRLTNGPIDFFGPTASADGQKVFVLGTQRDGEAVRYDMKTQTFAPYVSGVSSSEINPSRDGKWVTYVAYPELTLWRSRIDGSDKLQLTFPPLQISGPHWSPDGQRIAYRASLPGRAQKIFLISRDGGVPQELIPDDKEEEGVPTWSPDGNSLVFGELRWYPEKISIHILDLRTRQLSTVPGSRGLWTPRWSPDGRYLLALTADASSPFSKGLWLFDFRTQKWKKLLEHAVLEPVWSQDGKYIYFNLAGVKSPAVYRVRTGDGWLERIVSLDNFRSVGSTFSLAPDDSPVLLRDTQYTEIYALNVQW